MKKITLFTKILFTVGFILVSYSSSAQSPKTYSTSGTFTVPAGVTSVTAQAWGGGGKGGSRTSGSGAYGGGGGGAYAASSVPVNALSGPYTVTVGSGSSTTAAGEDSWFSTTGTVMAKGGQSVPSNSATGATGGLASASVGTTRFNGGNGANGSTLSLGAGGGGSSAGTGANGANGIGTTGGNAPAGGGNGGAGRALLAGNGNGSIGIVPGGGGGGAYRTAGSPTGGDGADGRVIISWTCATYSLTSTSIASPLCITNGAVVTVNGGAGLPVGNYTVSYTLSGTNTGSNTATMNVTTAGTGTFTTVNLNNIGLTNIQITNLSSGVSPDNCSNNITTNNTASVTLTTVPSQPSTITGNASFCGSTTQTYSVTNVAGVTYNWTFPAGWVQTAGGTTNSITVTTDGTFGNVTVTPSNFCGNGTPRTLTIVNASPTITSTTPGSRIGPGTVNLSATASGGTIAWYANAVGGTALGTGPNFTTPGITNTTTYYVETTSGACISTPRIAVVATINLPEITVLGNGNIILDEDTSPIITDFTNLGTTGVGVGLTRTYTIQNSGTVTLTLGTINITGINASEFVLLTAPATSILPAGSTTFSITFTPTALGIRNANVSFVTNDPDENPFNFDIAGVGSTGLVPEINLQGLGNTIIDGDSGPIGTDGTDFGSVTLPGTVIRTFTIQNTGTGPLLLTGTPLVEITGSTNFTVTAQPSSNTIAAGGSLTFQITFNPTLTGSSVAIVSINNNDADENVYDFAITGAAVVSGREIDVQGNDNSIVDGDTTPSTTDQTDFGITDASTPIALTYNIFSFGSSSLTLTSAISITGTNASMFSATALPTSLNAGAVTSFVITFTPTASLGIKTATITITSNDPDEATYNFDIRAEVQSLPPLTFAPGGITSNLKFWIKADSNIGFVSDNTALTTWQEKTYGNTKNAVSKFSKEPKFQNNPTYNVNFNPVVHFNGSNAMTGGQGFNNADMFIVVKPSTSVTYTSSPVDIYCGDDTTTNKGSQDVTGFEMGNTSTRHSNELIAYNQGAQTSFGVAEISTTKFYSGVNIFNPRKSATFPTIRMDILHNGNTLTTSSVFSGTYRDIINTRYWLGRSEFFDASYNGDILEIINYDTRNSDADKSKIESYLAIKYGITLGVNGTSQNYVDSNGTVIYGAGAGFNYNIAGIGRDDLSQLNQKQSKTENTVSDITIGLGDIFDTNSNNTNTFDANRKFLVWGHNNNTLDAQPPIIVDMSTGVAPSGSLNTIVDFISIARTWRVVETGGDVPSVKVSIPTAILTATINPPGDFLMFISDSPVFNPTAEYRIMRVNGSNLETDYDFSGTKYITFGYAPERTFVRSIAFDGVNDYLDAGRVLNLNTSFTVSSWVKRNSTNQTILSKRDNAFTTGYDLSINSAGRAQMRWRNGSMQTITSSVVIPSGIWHNIAVTYDGTTARLYIDGVLDVTQTMSTVPANNQSFLIAAADGVNTTSFFNGGIDEVRVWSVALTDKQLRYVMNQEISRDATLTGGTTIPNTITSNDIKSIPWVNLSAYYPMSTYTFTNAKDVSNNNNTAALKNLTTVDRQTAPLPYESISNGQWQTASTWLNNTVQYLPNSISIVDGVTPINWNIVKTYHNITSTGNRDLLALFVDSNTVSATNDTKIEISHYLKLDGKIDLVDKSQLIQVTNSDLDPTSAGSIERDQQGTKNVFNYNYWSSPVGTINNTTNNNSYSVSGVMKDGTTTTPQNITWTSGLSGSPTNPITLSSYWIFKFQNLTPLYANWASVGTTGLLNAGQGYTLKGSGAMGPTQNYTFVGKPNNGTITSPIAPNNLNLSGNPYASAIDATQFITDNAASTTGSIYFWEHAPNNTTHVTAGYQGGYSARNLTGGVPPVAPAGITGLGTSVKIPNRYIPVGQGFFVTGSAAGGTITFNNGQRLFVKEDNASSNFMFKNNATATQAVDHFNNNTEDEVAEDTFKKIRLGYQSSDNFYKQALLGFMESNATDGIDFGYDAVNIDSQANDLYFISNGVNLNIQGVGYFNANGIFPIGIKNNVAGNVTFQIDEALNFDNNFQAFIHDNLTGIYHNVRNVPAIINVPQGTINDRFSLRFLNNSTALGNESFDLSNGIIVAYTNTNSILNIKNYVVDTTVESVALFNLLGQSVGTWDVENQNQQDIQLPITKLSTGTYIVKVMTDKGDTSRKIIIK